MSLNPTTFSLKDWQISPAKVIADHLIGRRGVLLVAPTRTGKTYAIADAIVQAQSSPGFLSRQSGPTNVIFLTFKSIKIQSARVLKSAGCQNIFVESIDAFARGAIGDIYLEWVSKIVNGDIDYIPIWREDTKPEAIIVDECQGVRSENSLRFKLVKAAIEQGITVIFASATPFCKVSEAKAVALGTGLANNSNWPSVANAIAGGSRPDELNNAAMKRLNQELLDINALVKFENITYLHKAMNDCVRIPFRNAQQRAMFDCAYADYEEALRKAGREGPEGIYKIWAAQTAFRKRGELLRAPDLVDLGIYSHNAKNRQIIIASNYIDTLRAVWKGLRDSGVAEDKIGFLVGDVSLKKRQDFIDRFQQGEIFYMIGTLKCGGVGISLHHEFEQALPREIILPPTWSGIELVQMLGRGHGPTSLSTTHQSVVWFKDTIEEDVADRVKQRFSCLKEIATKKEVWAELFDKNREANRDLHGRLATIAAEESVDKDEEGEEIIFNIDGMID